jgi:hypothetical protein
MTTSMLATAALLVAIALPAAAQQKAGEIQHLQGMATAQQSGGALRRHW